MYDLMRLRIFCTVARHRNFTRAAEELYLAQPTVSQQVQTLEREVGAPLLLRLGRRIELTHAGQTLVHYAEQLLALAAEAQRAVAASAEHQQQLLLLGAGNTLATYILPDLLRRMQQAHPSMQIEIQVGNTEELVVQLEHGALEIALIGKPQGKHQLTIEPLLQDQLVVIAAPEHPFAQQSQISIQALADQPLFVREAGSALQAATADLLISWHVEPHRRITLANLEAIKRSVEAGLGLALVPQLAIGRELAAGTLAAIQLAEAPPVRHFVLAWHHDRQLSPAAQRLRALVRAHPPMRSS